MLTVLEEGDTPSPPPVASNDECPFLPTTNIIRGNGGNCSLYGSTGNDVLGGGAGNDRLYGDSGKDALDGGADTDRCYGGSGSSDTADASCETVHSVP